MGKSKSSVNLAAVILPAAITAVAGIIGAYFSYSAGVAAVRIPLAATQTAQAALSLAAPPAASAVVGESGTSGIPVAIDSASAWQFTGVTAAAGDIISIEVVGGKWTPYRIPFPEDVRSALPEELRNKLYTEIYMNGYPETAGSGDVMVCEPEDLCPMLGYRVGGLVARMGALKYFIGDSCTFRVAEARKIYLQINDVIDDPSYNFGVLAVEINIPNDINPVISEGCGIPTP
jgi:hypothetical protein